MRTTKEIIIDHEKEDVPYMRIGIHQPNFLPWMGYFYKIAQCDTFVFLDHVEFTKKSYTKRVKIHKGKEVDEEQYIIIPLKKHSDHAAINTLQIVNGEKWQKKIKAQIYLAYHKAPFYYQIEPLVERFFTHPMQSDSFSTFTIEIIKYVSELLAISTKWIISSELELDFAGSDVNFDIVSHFDGQVYLSGMGAKKYQNEDIFTENDIRLEYSDFPTHFETLNIPRHFLNKSILSYLACFDIKTMIKSIHTENTI